MKKEILIKFGEIFLKGENRHRFELRLLENIKSKIKKFGQFEIKQMGSVYTVSGANIDNIVYEIKKIFGISLFSVAWCVNKNLDEIKEASCREIENLNVKTFKVETKRSDKSFYLNSMQMCTELGSYISEKFDLKVDVHNPDVIVHVEIRNKGYVFCNVNEGAGGLPVGTSGLGTVMISGGIDSPVAAFMMAKRGLRLHAIHFSTPPYTSYRSVDKVKRILERVSEYSGPIKFFNINFSKIQKKIKVTCADDLTTIVSRRFMNRIAQNICLSERSSCLITGESLGQVASQTVNAMNCTSYDISIPMFRPLIGFDKNEIVNIAKKIGTFDISIEKFEDCCSLFSPKSPKINPILKFVENDERKLGDMSEMINETIRNVDEMMIG